MNIGIVTLVGYFNYGNRLQNYAVETVVRKMGAEAYTCIFEEKQKVVTPKYSKKQKIKNIINKFLHEKYTNLKTERFKTFTNRNINEILCDIKTIASTDFFLVGSDQVWNPTYTSGDSKYLLDFANDQQKKSFAASFGLETLPDEYKDQYKKLLSSFNHISVREEAGQKIIKDLLGIEVPVLVDPTLLLTKIEWLKIAKPHENKPKKKYLLTYYLGEEKENNIKFIKEYAKRNKLELVQLGDIKDKKRYTADPSEFIDYFNDASIIFTDSFHGSVFSIILKKPFVVFKRGNINSRIDTLLSKFNLENRHWDYVKEHKNFNEIDYSHVDEIMNEERTKSFDYLRNALGIKKEE